MLFLWLVVVDDDDIAFHADTVVTNEEGAEETVPSMYRVSER